MKKPRHLYNFPCMYPWIGSRYGCDGKRLAIVAERHCLPPNVTYLNYEPSKWYAARQEDVPDEARSSMDTRRSVELRHQSDNATYRKIEAVVSFEEIAFFNYVFRPAPNLTICDKDREVSSEIMEWFIRKHQPTAIVIASATVMQYTCVRCDLAAHPEIKICITDHPLYAEPFLTDVREFLKFPSFRGSRADTPLCLDECQKARCRSYPRRSGKPAS